MLMTAHAPLEIPDAKSQSIYVNLVWGLAAAAAFVCFFDPDFKGIIV